MMRFTKLLAASVIAACCGAGLARAGDINETLDGSESTHAELVWHADYATACEFAKLKGRMLLVFFYAKGDDATRSEFEAGPLSSPAAWKELSSMVLAKLPLDTEITSDGQPLKLLEHPAFAEMQQRQGIAIIDYASTGAKYFGHVVSTFPLDRATFHGEKSLRIALDLPSGTLTQRTMIYAVRMHPEVPRSTEGAASELLADEAEKHSAHQASIRLQGHHRWERRYHRITARLPSGVEAQEVVAESWPNEGIVVAAVDCVRSWRHSSGHWRAVRANHPFFAFDMKRGRNGIWYATGLFGRKK